MPTGIFGAHIFYRLPGGIGEPRSFTMGYAGREPFPGPRPKLNPPPLPPLIMAANGVGMAMAYPQSGAPLTLPAGVAAGAIVAPPAPSVAAIQPNRTVAADKRYLPGTLPESDINPAYRNSGQWIARP